MSSQDAKTSVGCWSIQILIVIFLTSCSTAPPVELGEHANAATGESSSANWYAGYLARSRLVPLANGRSLNLYCMGSGTPVVVLESGLGGSAFDWRSVQDRIAAQTRVCAYDRAGLGRSPAGPLPRDTQTEVADLESLLVAGGVRGPYVLVGHSMGGYNVRVFASRHIADVAGIVLVDPSVENQIPILEAAVPEIAKGDERTTTRARACANPQRTEEIAARCLRAAPEDFPESLARTFQASQTLIEAQTFLSEAESFMTVDSNQVAAVSRSLNAIPLIVLTRGELSTNMPPDQAAIEWKLWNQMHEELANLSVKGSNRVVEGSGHYIQLDRPEAVIVAVREVVDQARAPHRHSG